MSGREMERNKKIYNYFDTVDVTSQPVFFYNIILHSPEQT